MKLSSKGQYALEALIDLALHAVDGQENSKNIAQRRGIPEHYLEQIFAVLRKAGIVESIRGKQGGYRFAREPGDITAGEVLRALEGPLCPVKCVYDEEAARRCPMQAVCPTRPLWARVASGIDDCADRVTLAGLIEACRRNDDTALEYYI